MSIELLVRNEKIGHFELRRRGVLSDVEMN